MIRRTAGHAALLLWVVAGSWGCGESQDAVGERIAAAQDTTAFGTAVWEAEAAAAAMLEPGALKTVAAEPVHGRTGPGGMPFEVALRTLGAAPPHARRFGAKTLELALRPRTPDLSQYPCTSCHLGARMVLHPERIEDAHQDIQPVHPAETGATCSTCHAAADVELLVLQSGETLTLNHAYRLCAQCHFAQVDAWAGGAHGKRLDGWQGRRVVMGCADCHDPHQPALEARIPYPPPRIPRTGSREP